MRCVYTVVNKYRKHIGVRVNEEVYQKLSKQALTNGNSLSDYLRDILTKLVNVSNPEESQVELREDPKVLVAEPISQVKLKPVVMETEPSESLEPEKEKSLWDKLTDWLDMPIKLW